MRCETNILGHPEPCSLPKPVNITERKACFHLQGGRSDSASPNRFYVSTYKSTRCHAPQSSNLHRFFRAEFFRLYFSHILTSVFRYSPLHTCAMELLTLDKYESLGHDGLPALQELVLTVGGPHSRTAAACHHVS